MEQIKKIEIKPLVIAGIVAFLISAIITGLFWIFRGINLASSIDGISYSSVAIICSAGLIYVARNGFFDIFSYGFKQATTSIFSHDPREFNDFASYKEDKQIIRKKKSKYYLVFLAYGLLLIVISIILRICLG